MWICLSEGFLSIVHKDCEADELLVRARRQGDIERVFPDAKVKKTVGNDYLYRAVIKRSVVGEALVSLADNIVYDNFKNTVRDNKLHGAFNAIWHTISRLQAIAPYSRGTSRQKGLNL